MKRLTILFSIIGLTTICLFQACKKGDLYHSKVVPISPPTKFRITLNGPLDTTINNGAKWVDPGMSWYDSITGESGLATAVTLNPYTQLYNVPTVVNTSIDSAYLLVYIAYNSNGFTSPILTRGLAITNNTTNVNVAGNYTDSNGGTDSIYAVSRALYYMPNVDLQGNASVMCIKSNGGISVGTIYTADLTGAIIPETFTQDTINLSSPITFHYLPVALNVPPGSPSGLDIPIGVTVTFVHN